MVKVIINGVSIDVRSKSVKYTKQANDFADLSTVNTSFTYDIIVDKTPKNTQLFQQLGMIGDTSTTPYVLNTAQLIDNGAVLIEKGIPVIKETSDNEYKLFIQDGIVNVFKSIENKSLGVDLDLSELVHNKTAQSIIDSWTGSKKYRYLIADYNGNTNDGDAIDAQYQIPSVNVKYLWDKLFDYLGYSYTGNFDFINNKWITYPKPLEVEEGDIKLVFKGFRSPYTGSFNNSYKQWYLTWPDPLVDAVLINDWGVKTNITGNYRIALTGVGEMELRYGRYGWNAPFRINLIINGEVVYHVLSNGYDASQIWSGIIRADSIIEISISVIESEDLVTLGIDDNTTVTVIEKKIYSVYELIINRIDLKIETTAREIVDFRTVLNDFSIKDFFKEVMFRGGLTPFVDNITRNIDFLSLDERLKINKDNVIDISDKVVRRITEYYEFDSYAQKNILRLKYNNEEEKYNDGSLLVNNKNLEDKKILFESKFYTPDRDFVNLSVSTGVKTTTPLVRMWQKEVKEVSGVQEIE